MVYRCTGSLASRTQSSWLKLDASTSSASDSLACCSASVSLAYCSVAVLCMAARGG